VNVPRAASDGGVDAIAATLFGESASRVIVSVDPDRLDAVLSAARGAGVPAQRIGETGGAVIRVAVDDTVAIECAVSEAEARWSSGLENWMEDGVAVPA
jgi:AIR synthase related protein, C-terminal domain